MEPKGYPVASSACAEAFRSVKAGKNVFMWILLAMILIQLAAFILVEFAGVLDAMYSPQVAPARGATTQEIGAQAEAKAEATEPAAIWQTAMMWVLPTTTFIGLIVALLAVLTLMFAVKLAIVGRLGGIPGFMSAFYWSLILLAMVTPWQQILSGSVACGALFNLGELTREAKMVRPEWGAEDAGLTRWILYYTRFIGYPVLALIVQLLVMSKFSRGYRDSELAPVGTLLEERLGAADKRSAPPAAQ